MKKILLLGLLSVVLFSSTAVAAESMSSVLDAMQSASFFKDTKIQLKLRNHWKYLKEDGSGEKAVHNAWGQAFGINYKSGYLGNFIGFDATYTSAIKLGASNYFSTRGLLFNDGNGFDKKNAKGFDKFNERYVKFKVESENFNAKAKIGYQVLKDYGILTKSTRLAENSYYGYSATFNYNNFRWDNAYVTRGINRDSPNRVHFTTGDKKDVDYIATTGLTYKDKDLFLSYAFGEADKYSRGHVIEASYKPMQKLKIATQIYGTNALDTYRRMAESKRTFDKHAWHYAGDVTWKEQDWSLKFGVAYTDANKKDKIGYYNRHITKNVRGRFNAMTTAGADYMRDGELALTALGTYNFVPEVMTGIQGNYGQFNYKGTTVRNGEIALINIWTPNKESRLKDLSVFTLFGYGWGYKNKDNTPILNSDGSFKHSSSLSGEVVVEYRFDLL